MEIAMPSETTSTRPKSMQRATICLWLSASLVALLTVASWLGVQGIPSGAQSTTTNVITFALLALIANKVSARRNWARWVFAVIYVLGSAMFLFAALLAPQVFLSMPVVLQSSAIVQFALQTVALILLFVNSSRQWFRPQSNESEVNAL
jgi:peptidoglycan/LPS O-acetylase OafA/YrhL